MAVDSAFGARDAGWIRRHDLVEMLTFGKTFGDDAIGFIECFFIERCSFSGVSEESTVFILCFHGTVEHTWKVTGRRVSLFTSVTDIRRSEKQLAERICIDVGVAMLLQVMFDLIRDRGGIFVNEFADCLERHLFVQAIFDLFAILDRQVFVLFGLI